MKNKMLIVLTVAVLAGIPWLANATAGSDLAGQWVGNSQVEGMRSVARTTLILGAADAENSTLRIDGEPACTLGHGKYSADGDSWSLKFSDVRGGSACSRLAQGTFLLHAGNKPRSLQFEASYPGADGEKSLRRGALTRYP
jgi:hypothetical protein